MSGDQVRMRLAAMSAGELLRLLDGGRSVDLVPVDVPDETMYLVPAAPAGWRFGIVVREVDDHV